VLVDLAAIDRHRVGRRRRDEEPREEALRRHRRRAPVRQRHERRFGENEPGLLTRLAHRGAARGQQLVRRIEIGMIGRVDTAARKHPHPAERDLRVAAQEQRLETARAVADEDHRGRGNAVAHGREHRPVGGGGASRGTLNERYRAGMTRREGGTRCSVT
jgi:hypothetical protein